MRTATAGALLVVLVMLAAAAAFALGVGLGGPSGTLSERWVSDTARDIRANHHAPAAGRINGNGVVYAPVSGPADTPTCGLYALDATDGGERWNYSVPTRNCTIHSVADPTLADFDGDGRTEVLAATTEQAVVGFDARTGEEELRVNLTDYGYTQPVVGDVLGDDRPEIVVVDVKGSVFVIRPNGSVAWSNKHATYTWGQPGVADFDGDGETEIVVGSSGGGVTMYDADGSVDWRRAHAFGGSVLWMTTGQLDDDPGTELVVATDDGTVAALDGRNGTVQWDRNFGAFAAVHAVGDGDGDGEPEVYAVARDAKLRSLDAATGKTEWTTTLTDEDVQMTPPPSLADVDGDGDPELVAPSNDGVVSLVDPKGGDVLATYARDVAIYTHPRLADVDGDGAAEVYVMYSDGRLVALRADDGDS